MKLFDLIKILSHDNSSFCIYSKPGSGIIYETSLKFANRCLQISCDILTPKDSYQFLIDNNPDKDVILITDLQNHPGPIDRESVISKLFMDNYDKKKFIFFSNSQEVRIHLIMEAKLILIDYTNISEFEQLETFKKEHP